jgi:hypothetical protein
MGGVRGSYVLVRRLHWQFTYCRGNISVGDDVRQKCMHEFFCQTLKIAIFELIGYHAASVPVFGACGCIKGRRSWQRQRPGNPKLIQVPKNVPMKHRLARVRLHADRQTVIVR